MYNLRDRKESAILLDLFHLPGPILLSTLLILYMQILVLVVGINSSVSK